MNQSVWNVIGVLGVAPIGIRVAPMHVRLIFANSIKGQAQIPRTFCRFSALCNGKNI